jgi:indole-3-glycerol phosphate synthase
MDFLKEVVAYKRREIGGRRSFLGEPPNMPPRRSLVGAVKELGVSLIAEIKRSSPSEGALADVDAGKCAIAYELAGASAVSVLTDAKYFGGSLEDLAAVKGAVGIPVLRKDFIVDIRQLAEAKRYGADAVLLIAAILRERTAEYVESAHGMGLECLVEVHGEDELGYALESASKLIGVNNRDLGTLNVDLGTMERLAPLIPDNRLLVAESGIRTRKDVLRMVAAGADAVLVGSSIMKSDNTYGKIAELMGVKAR